MGEELVTAPVDLSNLRRHFLVLVLFVSSGCAALIYEIVWFQLLQFVIGSSAVSLAVLLGSFMGGMGLGSIALPRVIGPRRHPLRVYAALEGGLGILGIGVLFGMPYVDHIYGAAVGTGLPSILLRGAVCAACMLPPTVLMGATLPAIARWVESSRQGVSWLGLFYGGNIAGAVFGCLLAGFYLLRVHDLATATYLAASLNGIGAVLAIALAGWTLYCPVDVLPGAVEGPRGRAAWRVYVTAGISGACALAAEVIWTRLLSLMLGGTVYTFSIILAVFLAGLGIGSGLGAILARATSRPGLLLGCCQLLLAAAVAWSAYMLAASLPFWPVNPFLARSPWLMFQLDVVRCLWAVLPPTLLWGASFPLALAAISSPGKDLGRQVGRLYAANTLGGILGAVVASLFLVRLLGSQVAEQVMIGLCAAAAAVMLVPGFWPFRQSVGPSRREARNVVGVAAALLVAGCVAAPAALLARSVPAVPWELVAFGRSLMTYGWEWEPLYVGEGMNASIAVTELPGGVKNFHVSGRVEASNEPQDMRLQRMLGHLPALFHPEPRSVLVVGFGAGVTSGSFLVHPSVRHVVICEIEPLVPQEVAPYFARENHDVVNDRRVEVVYDDARHYVLTTPEKFDIITSDPIHPWMKGSATLYTREYFEICKRRLKPGGLITQWVPLYESNADVVKSEVATFFEVFPNGTIWTNDHEGKGYDIVLLGQADNLRLDADRLQERLEQQDHAAVAKSLDEVGFKSVLTLLQKYGGQARDLRPWLANAEINHDRNLRLQYLAGLRLNLDQSEYIADDMRKYRRLPENLFVGTGLRARALRAVLEEPGLGGSRKKADQ
jgi:spermidine synthase